MSVTSRMEDPRRAAACVANLARALADKPIAQGHIHARAVQKSYQSQIDRKLYTCAHFLLAQRCRGSFVHVTHRSNDSTGAPVSKRPGPGLRQHSRVASLVSGTVSQTEGSSSTGRLQRCAKVGSS